MHHFIIHTHRKRQIIDITNQIQEHIHQLGIVSGAAALFVAHTSAALTTADLDPGTDQDLLDFLDALTPPPPSGAWRHPHDPSHTPDHLLASLIGPSQTVLLNEGKLTLGIWQRIILVELDGPRERTIYISVVPESVE